MVEVVDQPKLQVADDAVGLQPAVERTLAVGSVKGELYSPKVVEAGQLSSSCVVSRSLVSNRKVRGDLDDK